jgi:flavin reductase (DIM6/NTAB) family NADH-FMN oxidoreductase RutF
MSQLDTRSLRDAFGSFMTGVTVVTCRAPDGSFAGFTANSFSSVSLDPPLLLVCPGTYLSSFETFNTCSHFAVNILAEGQEDVSNIFASFKGDRFAQISYDISPHGLPLIQGAVARFCCTTHQVVPAGDHSILVGEVTDFEHEKSPSLGYVGGRYFSLGLEREPDMDRPTICGAIIEHDGHVLLDQTPDGLRPIQADGAKRGFQRERLAIDLIDHNINAKIHQVYSSFDDTKKQAHHTYFLATSAEKTSIPDHIWVPIRALSTQNYSSPAIKSMMTRYALETQTRNFSLYLGDAETGDIHSLS